jgi:hypothetical protein
MPPLLYSVPVDHALFGNPRRNYRESPEPETYRRRHRPLHPIQLSLLGSLGLCFFRLLWWVDPDGGRDFGRLWWLVDEAFRRIEERGIQRKRRPCAIDLVYSGWV